MTSFEPISPDQREWTESRFTVPSIHCAGCIGKIERGLGAVAGIDRARVNFSTRRVLVRHEPALSEGELLAELGNLGFEAQPSVSELALQDDTETRLLLTALAVAGFGMMNVMLLSVSVWSGAIGATRDLFHWLSALVAVPVVAYAGRPFFRSAVTVLRKGRTNMDVPISIGVLLATGLSIFETATGGPHAYFDGAVMLLFFLLSGRVLDAMMRDRARAGIGALLARMGREATIVGTDGSSKRVQAERIEPGMLMQVAAGEALAADGEVVSGKGLLDASMLTGESVPISAVPGTTVYAGMVNLGQPFTARVTAAADDTAIAEIARLMAEAGQPRSRYVRIADRASRLYAPAVHTLALLSLIGWLMAGAGLHQALLIAVAVLIITCPCALGLAVPVAHVVIAGALMKGGVLVKDGSALERLAEVDYAVFDKTGTLTLGEPRPEVLDFLSTREKAIALGLAQSSRHPLSRGLAAALRAEQIMAAPLEDIKELSGEGITGVARDLGAVALTRNDHAKRSSCELRVGKARHVITFNDPVRPDARATIEILSTMNIAASVLSGDAAGPVAEVAGKLSLPCIAGVRPAGKLACLEELRVSGKKVLMVGDGLNDGPALAAAHVSIAPASASDVSRQAADAVFLGDSILPVARAVNAARKTMRIVRQNFTLAVGYNILAVPLAVAGFVTPLVAALAMSLSSLIVVGNSLRLARAA
ncbi:heavy metal translocating P-type ATPase [Parafrankia sp. BMG5.11]|uniref:heavy metal translocating P-type ATPase n=1 Tax=Parafrankia sp. BMG5.11 TaxID=222540 RepID=UPI00103B7FD0|nr:heavy metal translocating P-type ATPase [Parafrankia sp. BMG5.11]TCJ41299.1 cadmium-translocating P-type ATPase [Parafrankia sp. BMG5.11]